MQKNQVTIRWVSSLAVVLFCLGIALRLLHMITPEVDADGASWGVQALEILRGHLSFIFPSQLHYGNLEAWVATPLFWLWGPSPLLLCLFPTAVGLGLVWLVWHLGQKELGTWGGLAALAWTALPPFALMFHSANARGAYIGVPFLIAISFFLTLGLARGQRKAGSVFGLGVVWGLGLWWHLLMAPAVAACGLYLIWRQPSRLRPTCLGLLILGVLLGGLPLWWTWLQAIPHHEFEMQASLHNLNIPSYWPAWRVFWADYLPLLLGRPDWPLPPWVETLSGPAVLLVYGLVGLAALWGQGRALWRRSDPQADLLRLALWFLALYLATWILKGAYFQFGTWRHLVLMYAALPFVFGAGIATLAKWRPALALVLVLVAVGANLAGDLYTAHLTRPDLMAAWSEKNQHRRTLLSWLKNQGHDAVYCDWYWEAMPLNLDAGARVTVADFKTDIMPALNRRADAHPLPAWVLINRGDQFAASLDLAGVHYRRTSMGPYTVFDRVSLPGPMPRELESSLWRGSGGHQPEAAWDGDISTSWTTGTAQRPGQSLTVDLGREYPDLCQALLYTSLPGKEHDAPRGLRVELSRDGQTWQKVAGCDELYGHLDWSLDRPLPFPHPPRILIRFDPTPARWLRLVQTGQDDHYYWSLAELRLFRAGGTAPPVASPTELAQAVNRFPAGLPVYAPPQVLALLPVERDALREARLHDPPWALDLRQGAVICMPQQAWQASHAWLAPYLGGPPQVIQVNGWVVALLPQGNRQQLRPEPMPIGTRISTNLGPEMAHLILDQNPNTRWHSTQPQRPGQSLTLRLTQTLTLGGLLLEQGPWEQDYPRGLAVELSRDGHAYHPAENLRLTRGAPLWTGDRLMLRSAPLLARFAPQQIQALRLTQTGSHTAFHWSLAELNLLAPLVANK